jgi:hypothetical protein
VFVGRYGFLEIFHPETEDLDAHAGVRLEPAVKAPVHYRRLETDQGGLALKIAETFDVRPGGIVKIKLYLRPGVPFQPAVGPHKSQEAFERLLVRFGDPAPGTVSVARPVPA